MDMTTAPGLRAQGTNEFRRMLQPVSSEPSKNAVPLRSIPPLTDIPRMNMPPDDHSAPPQDSTPHDSPSVAKVSIVIPVYNEEKTIQKLIGMVIAAPLLPNLTREIICVNDCSRDGTAKKLDELPTLF